MAQERLAQAPAPKLLDYVEISAKARSLRASVGAPRGEVSMHDVVTACFPDVRVTGEPLPSGSHEVTSVYPDGRRIIIYNRRMSAPYNRVGIAHGLAHLIWDMPEPGELLIERTPEGEMRERRADFFAAEVLVPLLELDSIMPADLRPQSPGGRRALADHVDRVSSRLNVPRSLLRLRMRDLARVRKTTWTAS